MNPIDRVIRAWRLADFNARRADFYRDLAEMYQRSESLGGFFEGELHVAKLVKDENRAYAMRILAQRLQAGVGQGRISAVLATVVPRSDQLMLAGVEAAPDKRVALLALAETIQHQQEMRRVAISKSITPLVLLPLSAAMIEIISRVIRDIDTATPAFVRPHLWTGFEGMAKTVSELAMAHGLSICAAVVASFAALVYSIPRWTGPLRLKLDNAPVFSLYRDYQAGLLFASLSMLLQSDRPLKASLEDLALASSGWRRWQLRRAIGALEQRPTDSIGAFSRGLVGPYMLGRAYTLRRSAEKFSDVLIELGTKEGHRVIDRVKKSAITMSIATSGVAVFVATFMGVASMTVPNKFANLMQPSSILAMKSAADLPAAPK